jgi:4-amino-4-deoxy-L-arabinose transferase-like glycosyltransferase
MLKQKLSSFELLIVTVVCGFLFFYGLGSFGLVGADEPRYAQVAREMLERNDYVTPTLNGVAWLEKPALYYWRAMFAFETFGVKDWAARLPSATFALGMIAVIFFHMRRFRPGAQLDAALITASCAGVIGFARGASTDMQLAAPFTVAMLGWYAWYETGKKIWLLDLYFFLAIGTLAKGPVAPFLGGLIVLVFCALRRDFKAALRTLWLPGILLYTAIVLPWFVAVQMRNPQFLRVFIFQHNLERFATNTFQHRQPFWYYIPVFLLALVPWFFFAIPALLDALRSCIKDWRLPKASDERTLIDSFPEFLVIWTLLPILFFSISQSKLPGYILPAVAPCTILTADYLQRRRGTAIRSLVIAGHAMLAGIIVGLFLVFPYVFLQGLPLNAKAKFLAFSLSVGSFLLIYITLRRTGFRFLRIVTIVPVIIILGFVLRVDAPSIDNFYSARPVARDIETIGADARPIAVYNAKRELRYGLVFYRNEKISSYNEKDIPIFQHLLIAKAGSRPEFAPLLKGREFVPAGSFPAQHLEYYWVSAAKPAPAKPLEQASAPSPSTGTKK